MDKIRDKVEVIVSNGADLEFRLSIDRKINVLLGKSSTGKSYLKYIIENLDAWADRLDGCTKLDMLALSYNKYESDEYYYEFFNRISDSIIFLDEDFYGRFSNRIVEGINKSTNIFVLIMRKLPTNLTYSIWSIYELKAEKTDSRFIFKNVKAVSSSTVDCGKVQSDKCITEDTGIGLELARRVIHDNSEGAGSRYSIYNTLLSNTDSSNISIMADAEAFGSNLDSIKTVAKRFNSVIFYSIPSLEYVLLKSHFYNILYDEINNPELYCDYGKYLSMERFYTAVLSNEMNAKSKCRYNKADINLLDTYFNMYDVYKKIIKSSAIKIDTEPYSYMDFDRFYDLMSKVK